MTSHMEKRDQGPRRQDPRRVRGTCTESNGRRKCLPVTVIVRTAKGSTVSPHSDGTRHCRERRHLLTSPHWTQSTGLCKGDLERKPGKQTRLEPAKRRRHEPLYAGGLTAPLKALIRLLEPKMEGIYQKLQDQAREHEETLLELRRFQMAEKRETIMRNVETIRVKKGLTEVSVSLSAVNRSCKLLQESQQVWSQGQKDVVSQLQQVTRELKEERGVTRSLASHLERSAATQRQLEQFQVELPEVQRERDLLREGYDALVVRMLNQDDTQVEERVQRMEIALQAALRNQEEMHSKIQKQHDTNLALRHEVSWLHQQISAREGPGQRCALPTHINQWQLGHEHKSQSPQSGTLDSSVCLQMVEEVKHLARQMEELRELQAVHAETVWELEKTRRLLLTQTQLTQHCQAELDLIAHREGSQREILMSHLQNRERLLEVRAAQTRRLEGVLLQMKGRTQRECTSPSQLGARDKDRLLEIHLERGLLRAQALDSLDDPSPLTFCTHGLYDFPLQHTGLGRGWSPRYHSSSRYAIPGQRLFLCYLLHSAVCVELHRVVGTECQTLGLARLPLRRLLEEEGGVWGKAEIEDSIHSGHVIGWLEYWMRLTLPVNEGIGWDEDGEPEWIYLPTDRAPESVPQRWTLDPQRNPLWDQGKTHTAKERAEASRRHQDSQTQTADDSETHTVNSDELIFFPLWHSRPVEQQLRIEVLWLSLHPWSQPAMDPCVQQLYVEYHIPGVPRCHTEIPFSLPTPRVGDRVHYHFSRVIPLDPDQDIEQCQFLYSLIQREEPHFGRLRFVVVSEPIEGEDGECVDVGYSYVPLTRILETEKDIVEEVFDIWDSKQESEVIGTLAVTVEGAPALQAISAQFCRNHCSSL
ncbi:X-linked retinitis pigmentosa GTPase regulator-interacting protein 1-like isoform X2 [Narcine bancroftii]|uniref:X-linked retinitis pigmentosa GTPase regulator-interacting protein 1-like isoform X2 n=1 Tax=Narcine bancroftii TaxID=1343680 RepID=UPI003831BD31